MLEAAERIKSVCDQVGMHVLSLAAFENFEGHNSTLENRLRTASHWIEIASQLGAAHLQVPSQYSHDSTGDEKVVITELRELADLASAKHPPISIAYEALSWGAHHSTLESSLHVVEKVDRPNFGLCLDTFHVVTKVWADPFAKSGKYPNAETNLEATLDSFAQKCPLDKIFYIQLSDGERFDPPFSKTHPWYLEDEAPQFTWSKHARPFPGETDLGGYMPVSEVARSWIGDMGFKGWVSLETFDRRMRDARVRPEVAAGRGVEAWKRVQMDIAPTTKI